MPGFELVPETESDLSDIWRYSFETWGEAQADRYFDDILSCFEAIATGRAKTKALTEILPDIQMHRCRYHRIFFLSERPVVILAIFHERMDMIARLSDRL
jgi:plasmid stabilization system protein ParE